jgi:ATP-dependent DNA helicase RecG
METNDLKHLKGIGEKTLLQLHEAKIYTTKDLLNTLPKSYEDFFIDNKEMYVATILSTVVTSHFRVVKSTFKVEINKKVYQAVVFQKPYIKFIFQKGDLCLIKATFKDQQCIVSHIKPMHKQDKIESKYHIEGVKNHLIRKSIKEGIDSSHIMIEETLPKDICDQFDILPLKESYQLIHNPSDYESLDKAYKRLKIEEIITFFEKVEPQKLRESTIHNYDIHDLEEVIQSLPFELTSDQMQAIHDITSDLNKTHVMERLIQGDVGSGKTIVSFLVSLLSIKKGYQVAFMSPTEVLSEQHLESFRKLFKDVSSIHMSSQSSKEDIMRVLDGTYQMVFGTHALAYPNLKFNNLGLVIIDEQHKFGVDIRKKLRVKSETKDLLYLTATPIPRSLTHIMYGNASVSNIKSMPKGRQKITSLSVYDTQLNDIHMQIKKAVELKQHVFVVVPAIYYSEKKSSIVSMYESFVSKYKDKLFVLHGQMDKQSQLETIHAFKSSEGGVLLSTTMVEVGIDIKTATFMIVLDADYFGTSQLHQLRGRIGRGQLKGVFYMVSKNPNQERLQLLESIQDGFELSEKDLDIRGAGNLKGIEQSGKSKLKLNDYLDDFDLFMFVKGLLSEVKKSL